MKPHKRHKGTKSDRTFSSNAIRLSGQELLITGIVFLLTMLVLIPLLWRNSEKLMFDDDFRLSYEFRDDYWVYAKCAKETTQKTSVLFIGDSVIWGMYVDNTNTLTANINHKLQRQVAANLAIDGLHPIAMEGLLRHYGNSIKDQTVFIHLNPLWMNSEKYDLSSEEEMDIHHPRLVAQFSPKLKCYQEPFSTRMGVLLERNLPFFSLLNHIRLSFFYNEDFAQWVLDNPNENPASKISFEIDPTEREQSNSSGDWSQRGITKQDWDWVDLDVSNQWSAFHKTLQLLKDRNNRVCVMVGSINPYILTENSLKRYQTLRISIAKQLTSNNIEYIVMPDLPSDYYADASHPVDKGYAIMADQLLQTPYLKEY